MLHNTDDMTSLGKYVSTDYRYAALKVASRGHRRILLRCTNSKEIREFTGEVVPLDKPKIIHRLQTWLSAAGSTPAHHTQHSTIMSHVSSKLVSLHTQHTSHCLSCLDASVPLYLCTSVPLYLCTSVPLYLCTSVPLYLCTSVLFASACRTGRWDRAETMLITHRKPPPPARRAK
jgi:hypothetical protein